MSEASHRLTRLSTGFSVDGLPLFDKFAEPSHDGTLLDEVGSGGGPCLELPKLTLPAVYSLAF